MADARFSSCLFSLSDVNLCQPHINLASPPVPGVEAVSCSEDMSPGYEDSSTDITAFLADQRNHPGKVSLLSCLPAQNVEGY